MCVLRRILDRKQFIGLKKQAGKILNFYKKNYAGGVDSLHKAKIVSKRCAIVQHFSLLQRCQWFSFVKLERPKLSLVNCILVGSGKNRL